MTQIDSWVAGKKVLLLGFGREGQSTYRMLQRTKAYKTLTISDQMAKNWLPDEEIDWITGPDYQKTMDDYDVVFKSPGIVLERPVEDYRCRILSQTEVFFQLFREQIVGITGTKGKSTTTSLLYHILKSAGRRAMIAGNIGIPAFDRMDEIEEDTEIVFELSCHQLEYMTVSPHTAVLLNIHEEHLDHYGTMEKYVAAKEQIYRNQKPGDVLLCNVQCLPEEGSCRAEVIPAVDLGEDGRGIGAAAGDGERNARENGIGDADGAGEWNARENGIGDTAGERAREERNQTSGRLELIGSRIRFDGVIYQIPTDAIHLMGHHNYFDIALVYAVCRRKGITDEEFTNGLKSYEPLPHRLHYLGIKDGVKYYDDSISTICDTTIQALNTLTDADTVLIGGMDRGIDYKDLIEYLSDSPVPHIILMEATGKRILEEIRSGYPEFLRPERLHPAEHLADAVETAKAVTRPGRSCVLSPAAASYGIFKNFEERGDAFGRLVFGADFGGKTD